MLEVGAGRDSDKGVSRQVKVSVSVEIDKRLFPILMKPYPTAQRRKLVHGDILKLDIDRLIGEHFSDKPFKIVANLPYYITTPILMMFLEKGFSFETR